VCGPMFCNYAHIGNARPAVVFDVLSRLLRHDYPQVVYTRNFTDVDALRNELEAESFILKDTCGGPVLRPVVKGSV